MPTQGELSGLHNTSTALSAANAAGWTINSTWSSSLAGYGAGGVAIYYAVSTGSGNVYTGLITRSFYVSCVR
jgi:hypothetical protein